MSGGHCMSMRPNVGEANGRSADAARGQRESFVMRKTQQPGTKLRSPFTFSAFRSVRILEVELGHELPAIPAELASGKRHDVAFVLVRLHSVPIGSVALELGEHGLNASDHARAIWSELSSDINEHLVEDGLGRASELPAGGLRSRSRPRCLQARDAALAEAPLATVVIATRDRPGSLEVCLDSVLRLDYPRYEVIVVDNAPTTSETRDLVENRYGGHLDVRYVRHDRRGLARARNRGLAEARGELVAFTDDDVIVDRWWLLGLATGFDADRIGCVTGMILPAEIETPSQAWLEQYGGFTKGFRKRMFDISENRPETILFPYAAGMFGSGANMAFRTEILRRIGGFDAAIGAGTRARGGEDLAAFFDVVADGYTLVYAPGALVYHRHRRDYESLREQAYAYGVGLGAYLTKVVVDKPTRLFDITRRLPHGVTYLLSSASEKNASKGVDYPSELSRMERRGMLYGPIAYLRSRREATMFVQGNFAHERMLDATGNADTDDARQYRSK